MHLNWTLLVQMFYTEREQAAIGGVVMVSVGMTPVQRAFLDAQTALSAWRAASTAILTQR